MSALVTPDNYEKWIAKTQNNGMANQNTLQALSWRRLFLARAKLKATSRTSALLSGFAMVAMVEADISTKPGENGEPIPEAVLVTFGVTTTLLVAIHLIALMISTCILPNIEAISSVNSASAVNESPHDKMHFYIEMAWIFSTGIGLLLFLAQMALMAWVRFQPVSKTASIASTVVIIPALIIFVGFAIHFYRQLVEHKYERHTKGLEELETMANELDPLRNTGVQSV